MRNENKGKSIDNVEETRDQKPFADAEEDEEKSATETANEKFEENGKSSAMKLLMSVMKKGDTLRPNMYIKFKTYGYNQ